MVRQCMSEPEEEVRARAHAPTPTRVLSEEERVPTWTPTATVTPTPTATYTPTATATVAYTPTPLPTLIGGTIGFDASGQVDTQKCSRRSYEQTVSIIADVLGKSESDYAPFDCLWFVQAIMNCATVNGVSVDLNVNDTLSWHYWTRADGSFVTRSYLKELWNNMGSVDQSCLIGLVAKK